MVCAGNLEEQGNFEKGGVALHSRESILPKSHFGFGSVPIKYQLAEATVGTLRF
jgi:hypothetical protein